MNRIELLQCVKNLALSLSRKLSSLPFYALLIVAILLFPSCEDQEAVQQIEGYYYPIDELTEGMVYEYHPVNDDQQPMEYWLLKSLKTDTATYLTGQYFDHNFTVKQFFSAEIVSNGVLMNEYSILEYDSLGSPIKRPAEILVPNSFPFEVKDSTGVFLFKLKWDNPTVEDVYLELIRNRRFRGFTEEAFKGKKVQCVEFKLQELVDDFNNGHLEKQFNGKELYAKDIGLIYYRKEISKNFVQEYKLVDRYPLNVFEEKFKQYYSEE